ncbi:YkgJ family cysteine cluster protein, partial [Desulfobotulus sp. H1]
TTRCADCCHALFDLSLVEAIYIKEKFDERFSGAEKHVILEKANRADRKTYRIKKDAAKERNEGVSEVEILGRMSMERVRCPLLGEDETCQLYEFRPLTCRLYGIPTSSNGVSHTCGKSAFAQGKPYPTVNMDALYEKLYQVSKEMVDAMETRYTRMAEMLIPLSMALLTDFNEEYLGIVSETSSTEEDKG